MYSCKQHFISLFDSLFVLIHENNVLICLFWNMNAFNACQIIELKQWLRRLL